MDVIFSSDVLRKTICVCEAHLTILWGDLPQYKVVMEVKHEYLGIARPLYTGLFIVVFYQ